MAGILENYRGHGYVRGDGCQLPAHYAEMQALCDALSFAAQLEMTEAIRREDALGRERAYGKWLALRGVLRALEGRVDEWTSVEKDMLALIDWDREQFRFPGIAAFDVELTEPGA
ncbi:MAG TPA: hypothetical protein VK009_18015 [Chloroflexota bacterium]|nr:hypothetical protein [Chloroflexota bacterium]